ncbi:MAG: response regulator, partial [Planctomycetota bacterium]|nr:response regulator [Planctomycetota bacterium]
MREILITDPDALAREQLLDLLESQHKVCVASCAGEALELMNQRDFDLVVADMNLSRQQESQFLKVAREVGVIMTTAFGTIEDAVQAMQDGAIDFLTKPFSDEQITLAIERALETRDLLQENQNLREALDDRLRMDNMIATDAKVQSVFKQVKAVAKTRTTVLVTGESGTGKTLLARAI